MIYAIGIIAVILGVALDQYTKYLAITHLQIMLKQLLPLVHKQV